MFHGVKGKNITFYQNGLTAAWTPVQSGGLTFTEKPLCAGEPVTLTLEGTGAIELGILHTDPATLLDNVPDSTSNLKTYHFLNDVKIHKRTCTMNIRLDDKTQEVVSSYGGGQYKQDIDSNILYWLVADVKYGEVELKLENSDYQNQRYEFSDNCGSNMKKLNNPSIVKSQVKSPASICFFREPVLTGNRYVLHCTPKSYQGTIPGRYYILIRYTNQSPEEFHQHNEEKFDVLKQNVSPTSPTATDWYQIEKFEKEDCTGNPIIVHYTGDSFRYKTASGKHNRQNCTTNGNSGIWLVFELYGVSARLEVINVSDRRSCEVNVDGGRSIADGGYMTVPCILEEAEYDTPTPARHPDTVWRDTSHIGDPVRHPDSTWRDTSHIGDPVRHPDTVWRDTSHIGDPMRHPDTAWRDTSHIGDPVQHPDTAWRDTSHIGNPVRHPDTAWRDTSHIDDPVLLEKAIRKNYIQLRDSFNVIEFIDYLFQCDILTHQEFEILGDMCNQNRSKATKSVLMILSARPVSKKFMLMALENTKQQFLVSVFFPDEEKE